MERNDNVTQSLCIVYDGAVVEVASLKEGLMLADEMVCENGSDITIVQNEEVIARREWIAESEIDDPFGDPMDAERDPIVFEGYGFYSDWLIDQNYKEIEITDKTFSELLDSGRIRDIEGNQYKTFGELLNSNQAFDCELIIGDVDMPASFVWNEESRITPYGCDYFKPLMACS